MTFLALLLAKSTQNQEKVKHHHRLEEIKKYLTIRTPQMRTERIQGVASDISSQM